MTAKTEPQATKQRLSKLAPGVARAIWVGAGSLALVLGAIGTVLPILPTTPFVILAAFCFGKGSPKFQKWLLASRVFGPVIQDWNTHGAIAVRYKSLAILMMGAALALSVSMGLPRGILLLQVIVIAIAATYILSRPNGPE